MNEPQNKDRTMNATKTSLRTADGLVIYDLDPQAASLVAVAGPDGLDPNKIDIDELPDGFRWIEDDEWEEAVERADRQQILKMWFELKGTEK